MEGEKNRTLGFLLASVLTSYPDQGYPERLRELLDDPQLQDQSRTSFASWGELHRRLHHLVSDPEGLDRVRSDYVDLFDRSRDSNPLYETEYGRDRALAKGRELADIAGFYRAFAVDLDREGLGRDMVDHVAIELEFYALLLMKQARLAELSDSEGSGIVMEARKSFLSDHLGRFVAAIAERPGVGRHAYYSLVFGWVRDLVSEECASLGISPALTGWVSGSAASETMSCGGSAGCGAVPGGQT